VANPTLASRIRAGHIRTSRNPSPLPAHPAKPPVKRVGASTGHRLASQPPRHRNTPVTLPTPAPRARVRRTVMGMTGAPASSPCRLGPSRQNLGPGKENHAARGPDHQARGAMVRNVPMAACGRSGAAAADLDPRYCRCHPVLGMTVLIIGACQLPFGIEIL